MFWKVRAMPRLRDVVALLSDDRLAVEANVARRRVIDAGDHVEDGGLARAVRADEPHDLAGIDVDRDVVEGGDATELHRHAFESEEWLSHRRAPA